MSGRFVHYKKVAAADGFYIGGPGQEKPLSALFEPGNQYFVDSGTGYDTNDGLTWSTPLATLDAAFAKCTANNGDIIWIAPGHAESWTTTGAKVVADVAGVRVIGLGEGAARPTFTFGHTGTTWTISAASVLFDNVILVSGVDSITTMATISGDDCVLGDPNGKGIEVRDTTDVEVIDAFTVTGDRFKSKVFHNGYTGGNANLRTYNMTGVDNAEIYVIALGKAGTAVVNFTGTACTNVIVKGIFLVTSTATLAKNVVDTIGGSTWSVEGFDIGAGCSFSGGSGAAVQKDDVGAITALIGTLANSGGTATLGGILGDVSNVSVATSLAKLGTIVNAGGTATIGAILGDFVNSTLAARLGIADGATTESLHGKLGTDTELADRSIYDIVNGGGPATAATAAAPANDVSLYGALRAVYNLSVPAAATGETVIDEGDYDWTSAYPALLTIAPAVGAPLTDVVVHLDLAKAVTGYAAVYAAQTLSVYVARKVDGTNWRREAIVEAALSGTLAASREMKVNIGDVGVTEQVVITAALSAEKDGTSETTIPYVVYYKGLAAPTVTPLTATP